MKSTYHSSVNHSTAFQILDLRMQSESFDDIFSLEGFKKSILEIYKAKNMNIDMKSIMSSMSTNDAKILERQSLLKVYKRGERHILPLPSVLNLQYSRHDIRFLQIYFLVPFNSGDRGILTKR